LDLIHADSLWYLIEANMAYGRQAMHMQGLDIKTAIHDRLQLRQLAHARR